MKADRTQQFLTALRDEPGGVASPAAGQRLKNDLQKIDHIPFVSLEIGHLIFVPTFITSSRVYVAKAVFRDEDGAERTRYFSLTARNNFFDFFWVNEHSRLIWWFTV